MALNSDVNVFDFFGEEKHLTNVYIKVDKVLCSKDLGTIFVSYRDYQTKSILSEEKFSFVPSTSDGSENFIKQAYLFLKEKSKFQNATDC